jgi:hypothetical protein
MEEFGNTNNPANIHLSEERKQEFYTLMHKHMEMFIADCKEHKIIPYPTWISFMYVRELDDLNQRLESNRQKNKEY